MNCQHLNVDYRFERLGAVILRRWVKCCDCPWTASLPNDIDGVKSISLNLPLEEFRYLFTRFSIGSKVDEACESLDARDEKNCHANIDEAIRACYAFREIAPLEDKRATALVVRLVAEAKNAFGDNAGLEADLASAFGPKFDANGIRS